MNLYSVNNVQTFNTKFGPEQVLIVAHCEISKWNTSLGPSKQAHFKMHGPKCVQCTEMLFLYIR